MAYADLTTEEQEKLDQFMSLVRPLAGQFASLTQKIETALSIHTDETEAILAKLQDADLIPNKTGLGDAREVMKAELANVILGMQGVDTNYNLDANHTVWRKLAGINAVIN